MARTTRLRLGLASDRGGIALGERPARLAALSVLLAAGCALSIWMVPGIGGWLGAGLFLCMTCIAVVDARHFIIPDSLVALALLLGILNIVVSATQLSLDILAVPFVRALGWAAVLFALRAVYRRLRGREGIGLGDVKLAAVAGLWLDVLGAAVSIEVAVVLALLHVASNAVRGVRFTRKSAIPFGLYFAPAIWIVWVSQALMR